ncbi:hypothetical protein F6V30_14170 [Oryzomonas sagensis]|uniref:Uncharacterized protein n=1 Tax=Oryzomonas sagensis TaxID=2603857 RepID=A0ABQ6TL38_9BACT|nr:hypothetical protein [Oryzomonas sagensis]KAB0668979.1 hypothetical protein F6V30_14170 [Oryzomonas sagensis]
MKAYKPLQDAFRKMDTSTVHWHKTSKFPKTMETANAVLYRDAVVDASTLAYLAHCLGLSNAQVVAVLDQYAKDAPKKAAETAILKKLIAPIDLNRDEQDLIEKIRKLDDAKRKLVAEMVRSL